MGKETIAQMSPEELREMIEEAIANSLEEKLMELFGDPDEGLVLREEFKEKLMRQREGFSDGRRKCTERIGGVREQWAAWIVGRAVWLAWSS